MHGGVHGAHQGVDVFPTPIGLTEFAAGAMVAIPTAVVRERDRCAETRFFGVGVEVVVDVDAIDVVAADDVGDDLHGLVAGLGESWVKPEEFSVVDHEIGLGPTDVLGGNR